jgi:hypothetical protein
MNKFILIVMMTIFAASLSYAGFLDDLMNKINIPVEKGLDQSTMISGLKEALSIGTENAVQKVSSLDGYLGNQAIKILMPEKMQTVANVLEKFGQQDLVDEFITSMNRAAEKAAPQAVSHFASAIKEMSFEDARNILEGGDTAATEYFKSKTYDNLYTEFKPIISSSMNDVGVTKLYKELIDKYTAVPLMQPISLNLDHHVTEKSLNGLFFMVAEEEKKIRNDQLPVLPISSRRSLEADSTENLRISFIFDLSMYQ